MDKSPDAFRTISEVAEWLGVQTHVLRFWESKFSQVKPVKRAGGRRYYRPSDMALLGGIKQLLHDDGMTIKGVQKLLREKGVGHVSSFSQTLDSEEIPLIEATSDAPAAVENVVPFQSRPDADQPEPASAEAAPEPKAPEQLEAPLDTPAEQTPEPAAEDPVPDAAPVAAPDPEPAPEDEAAPSPLPSFLTQPMGGTPAPEPARALVVDAPDPPLEAEITVNPGVLSMLADTTELSADQSRAIAPLISRLAVLRDSLARSSG